MRSKQIALTSVNRDTSEEEDFPFPFEIRRLSLGNNLGFTPGDISGNRNPQTENLKREISLRWFRVCCP
jgi:hypothetical protein